ncbi:hypothetical protein [Streptomyces erythrochromogenes]|uniref:hypothetical protein n=1 Tax=Streptomyces erythrochromogenes TaxID=285574 RepID=UPI0036843590
MTRTRLADGTLRAPLADLALFLRHLVHPSAPSAPGGPVAPVAPGDGGGASAGAPLTRAWTAESLRIRTGELTPARGLLWHPAPHGVWTHHAPTDPGPAVWISPRHHRWAVLLPAAHGPLRTTFREAVFTPDGPTRSNGPGGIPRA